ncbi:tetratricopeptide repeat protein [Magnetococcales bacterium HHB-1]
MNRKKINLSWVFMLFSLILFSHHSDAAPKKENPWLSSVKLEAKKQYLQAAEVIKPFMRAPEVSEYASLRYAWLTYLAGKYNASVDTYYRHIDGNPDSVDARLGITLPLMAQQRWREVAKHCQKIIDVSPLNHTAHLRLLIAEEGMRSWHKMLSHAQELARYYPSDATIRVYLARAHAWLGQKSQAKKAYREVLQRVPGHYEATDYIKKN